MTPPRSIRAAGFFAGLDPLDRWLAALRVLTLVGGGVWLLLHIPDHPADAEAHRAVVGLLGVFAGYSTLLYAVNTRWPGRLRLLYRVAMGFDLAFIVSLVRLTGGMASDFYLAFYLLIALHAFYFGLATGTAVGTVVGVLYFFVDAWPPPIRTSDLALRLGFFLLVGLAMGGLAERERRERRLVEQLNRQLHEQHGHLEQTRDQLIRSDRLATVGELAASLAHDLRNPLAGISGALHVLAGQLPSGNHQQGVIADIQGEIARINKTLADLLWHARPPEPEYLPLGVNEILAQSLRLLPGTDSRIEIVQELAPDLPPLRVDPRLLHQAFLNILLNACQAMPSGGRVTVGTRVRRGVLSPAEAVEVTITDTGTGVSAEHLSRIFQPFFTTKAQGTGLGLAIAARIVDQHGGRIGVTSLSGAGATFRIVLPVPTQDTPGSGGDVGTAARR